MHHLAYLKSFSREEQLLRLPEFVEAVRVNSMFRAPNGHILRIQNVDREAERCCAYDHNSESKIELSLIELLDYVVITQKPRIDIKAMQFSVELALSDLCPYSRSLLDEAERFELAKLEDALSQLLECIKKNRIVEAARCESLVEYLFDEYCDRSFISDNARAYARYISQSSGYIRE